MRRALLVFFSTFVLGFFVFLLIAPFNQSFAVPDGATCRTSINLTQEIACDANLNCDTSADTSTQCADGKLCKGVCRSKPCTVRFSDNGSNPNSCDSSKNEVCDTQTCSGNSCSGFCVQDTSHHVNLGGGCKIQNSSDKQGNCDNNLICNVGINRTDGICYPDNYTCKPNLDSRTNIQNFSCTGDYTCVEDNNKQITISSQRHSDTGIFQQSANDVIESCNNCTFSCKLSLDVKIDCKCDNLAGLSKGSERNGFTCKNAITSQHSFCQKSEQGCYNEPTATMTKSDVFSGQTLSGIQCLTDVQKFPPAPPCNHFDANGKCDSIVTSLGNFSTDPSGFISRLFGILLGAAGAIAVLLFSRAGYKIMSSRGNPEGIKEGREQLVAAIVGLIFLIFSFVILEVIGVDLLRIPNFASSSGVQLNGTCDDNANKCATGLVCNYTGGSRQCQKP